MSRTVPGLAVVALVLALAGCGDDEPVGTVVVIGDSVTDQSADRIVDAIGDDTAVLGLAGYRTDELLPVAQDALAGSAPPEVAVVMAGYNDLWQGREDQDTAAEIIDLMAEVDCAVWVLVPTVGPWDRDRARAFDDRVRAAAEAAGVPVEDGWQEAVDESGGAEADDPLVVGDGVHPTDAGQRKVAEVMADAVDREC
jgi:lysophospholipase L1-like esterase